MKPIYWKPAAGERDRWMISYMDVLTILLIFFIAAAAHGVKAAPLTPVAVASVPASRPSVERLHALYPLLEIHTDARGLIITLPQTVLFAPGDDRVTAAALPVVGQIAAILRDVPNRVSLIGHADSTPIHNRRFRNNWALSGARSLRLMQLLSQRDGIP